MDSSPSHEPIPTTFRFVPMTAPFARAILTWKYESPYDFYNADPDVDDEELAESFLNPAYHYYALLDKGGPLIAYRCFGEDARVPGGDYSAEALDMGGGLRPDLTGRGLGPTVMRAAIEFARGIFCDSASGCGGMTDASGRERQCNGNDLGRGLRTSGVVDAVECHWDTTHIAGWSSRRR